MKRYALIVGLLLVLVLAACDTAAQLPPATSTPTLPPMATPTVPSPGVTPTAPMPTPTPTATATPLPEPEADGLSLTIPLHEQNESGQTGTATLTAMGSQTEVIMSATPGISRANHIHTGTCADLGGVAHPLTNMEDGTSETVVDVALEDLLTGGFAINLHDTDDASIYTACGDIPTAGTFVSFPLEEQNDSGQTGTATLIARGEQTDVVLLATEGISSANHIHTGTCADLGGVEYPLTNMEDGRSITTIEATLESLGTGGFAINLHDSDDASIYTACGDIPSAALTAAQGADLVIPLGEQNDSGQTGVAVLASRGESTYVVLQATPGISRANHIHTGTCANLGGVSHGLTNMENGLSSTTVSVPLEDFLTGEFAINLHDVDDGSIYTSCGDLPAAGDYVTFALGEQSVSGQTGVATLIDRGDQTDVVLLASAGISRANHIHTGTCADLGGVAHPLTNMEGGMSVTTVDVALADLMTGGFAINLHDVDDASIYTSCGDIPSSSGGSAGAQGQPVGGTIIYDEDEYY